MTSSLLIDRGASISQSGPTKILVADDDPHIQDTLRILLEQQGYLVETCSRGDQVLEIFDDFAPDLLILDVQFKESSGFDICATLREHPLGVDTPVILLTALGAENFMVEGLDHGADDYIVKPFRPEILSARIRSQLERVRRIRVQQQARHSVDIDSGRILEGTSPYRYLLQSCISSGPMGQVFQATELSSGQAVALKAMDPASFESRKDLQRFLRESRATMEFDHPHLARGIDVVSRPDRLFYCMEFLTGSTLAQTLQDEGFLSESRSVRFGIQLASALIELEKHELVHRDIKPENIILTDGSDRAVLVDYGLAQRDSARGHLTTEGVILGTPYYLSPEQVKGQSKLDARSDIYSLGATLYFMVTGAKPFDGRSTVAIINQRLFSTPTTPHTRNPLVSDSFSQVIQKMLAREPKNRYENASELLAALQSLSQTD